MSVEKKKNWKIKEKKNSFWFPYTLHNQIHQTALKVP